MKTRVLYWFRTDLRIHDSPALQAALELKPEVLYPTWCWDPHYVYRSRVGVNRWSFLLDAQNDLSSALTKLNSNQKLLVVRAAPQDVLPHLFKAWQISHLVYEEDTDAYGRERDEHIKALAEKLGVKVVSRCGRTLYDSNKLVEANGNKPTMSITQVQTAAKKLKAIPRPIPAPKSLPDPGELNLEFGEAVDQPPQSPDFNSAYRRGPELSYKSLSGPNGNFAPPTLDELGMPNATTPHEGGETEALRLLDKVIADETYTATFEKPKTSPAAFEPPATTFLSPYLHFGCLSCREFYWRVQDVVDAYSKKGKRASHPPTSLTGQLLFREMYFGAHCALGHKFGQSFDNPTCRWIPWHLPSRIDTSTGLITGAYDIDNPVAETHFRRWKQGRTGFPWIDALMRQLRLEGWIHHLGRHSVACFLTRGGCYIDWERGAEVFEEWLIDHEAACNIGNWQWLACAAFYSQFYRCYSPVAFGKKWDPEGKFVRKYVPELKDFPEKYIYEPWKAPIADQKAAGVLIKGEEPGQQGEYAIYPKPMFDFSERREICIQAIKKAYEIGLHGNDPRVLDGTWRKLFDDHAEGPTTGNRGLPGAMVHKDDEGDHADEADDEPYDQQKSPETSERPIVAKKVASMPKKRGAGKAQMTLDGMVKKTKK